ncbi:MAG: hypothetical protein HC936_10385 [Leptolyngbyaceae cyanobacterium SU_3_3]|nr:hypothetical protein [Leptolyngbyaceae cyanobacterium SU_3_3]
MGDRLLPLPVEHVQAVLGPAINDPVRDAGMLRVAGAARLGHDRVDAEPANAGKLDSSTHVTADFAGLRETRRMKLNELHYFDHPLFGMFMRCQPSCY